MKDNVIWTCTFCRINPTNQSSRKCPRCGRKLTPWDISNAPLERKPEWPIAENKRPQDKDKKHTDYTQYFNKN